MMNKRKGQMSLEMIIGLVILLVVATVVVTMFIDVFELDEFDEMDEADIERECENLCQDWQDADGDQARIAAINYCTATFVHDADDSGIVEGEIAEQDYLSYCQDGAKCFHFHECQLEYGGEQLDPQGCMEWMCEYYDRLEDEPDDVNDIVENYFELDVEFEGAGSCDLDEQLVLGEDVSIDTWYTEYFVDTNPCDEVGVTDTS